jgi:hypothetical protein
MALMGCVSVNRRSRATRRSCTLVDKREKTVWDGRGWTLAAHRNVTPTDNSLQKCVAFAAGNDGSIPGSGNQTLLLTHLFFLYH